MKIDLDTVESSLNKNGVKPDVAKKVIDDLKQAIEEEKQERQLKAAKKEQKNKYILANTAQATGKTPITEVPMMVVEALDSVPRHSLVDIMVSCIKEANANDKALKKNPVKTLFESIDAKQAVKYFKKAGIRILTKELPVVVDTNNPAI